MANTIIIDYVESHDNELRCHFAGSYVNEEGNLVVNLSCDTDYCKNFIINELGEELKYELRWIDIIFETGKGSYYEVQKQLKDINEKMFGIYCRYYDGEKIEEYQKLMEAYPAVTYDIKENVIVANFRSQGKEKDQEIIDCFKSLISDDENIKYNFILPYYIPNREDKISVAYLL